MPEVAAAQPLPAAGIGHAEDAVDPPAYTAPSDALLERPAQGRKEPRIEAAAGSEKGQLDQSRPAVAVRRQDIDRERRPATFGRRIEDAIRAMAELRITAFVRYSRASENLSSSMRRASRVGRLLAYVQSAPGGSFP